MTQVEATFQESTAAPRVASLPMSHLSVELGHLYLEDFAGGAQRVRDMLDRVAPWARTAREVCAGSVRPKPARVSTCFLVDDYFAAFSSPGEILPMLTDAASAAELTIDYLVRESACADTGDVQLAHLVAGRLVADPPPGTNGSRPVVHESGWLCNGVRSPQPSLEEAMRPDVDWEPPSENGANRHSIFVDVELWSEKGGDRLWSCPFLAAVWQLLRLGVLRVMGEPVVVPTLWEGPFPDVWRDLPAITQLNPRAAPFAAYRTFSVLGGRFLPIEQAVRTILSQVAVEPAVELQIRSRASGENVTLSSEVVDRIEYAFTGTPWR